VSGVQVTNERKWRDATGPFQLPPDHYKRVICASKYHINLLHHFQQAYFFRNSGLWVEPPGASWLPCVAPVGSRLANAPHALPSFCFAAGACYGRRALVLWRVSG